MRHLSHFLTVSIFILFLSFTASAQDFRKTYQLASGSQIRIGSISGDIKLVGYDGAAVEVVGYKEGRDAALVEIEESSSSNSLDIKPRYPRNCNCSASVRFEVKVPKNQKFNFESIGTASGDIEIKNVSGNLKVKAASGDLNIKDVNGSVEASTASGDVTVTGIAGSVSAKTASGDANAELDRVEATEKMEFSSVSGDVNVTIPSSTGADVDISTLSGEIKTDFGIKVDESEHGSSSTARGRIGNGAIRLVLKSVSGDVNLKSGSLRAN